MSDDPDAETGEHRVLISAASLFVVAAEQHRQVTLPGGDVPPVKIAVAAGSWLDAFRLDPRDMAYFRNAYRLARSRAAGRPAPGHGPSVWP